MAASPEWKVYRAVASSGSEYVASCKYAEDAAALVAVLGDGATIRYRHKLIVWTEGEENVSAGDSYDAVATIAHERAAMVSK